MSFVVREEPVEPAADLKFWVHVLGRLVPDSRGIDVDVLFVMLEGRAESDQERMHTESRWNLLTWNVGIGWSCSRCYEVHQCQFVARVDGLCILLYDFVGSIEPFRQSSRMDRAIGCARFERDASNGIPIEKLVPECPR